MHVSIKLTSVITIVLCFIHFQMMHVISFSLALLGLIYNSLADKSLGIYLGIISASKYGYFYVAYFF